MLDVVDGESIVPLFSGKTPQRKRGIYFGNKGTALIDGHFKLVQNGNGKGVKWELYDLEKDLGETKDLSKEYSEVLKKMIAEAEATFASVLESEQGKDYPEGKVLQPQRSALWSEMPEYQTLYDLFAKLKPEWKRPSLDKKSAKDRRAEKKARKKKSE